MIHKYFLHIFSWLIGLLPGKKKDTDPEYTSTLEFDGLEKGTQCCQDFRSIRGSL